MKITRDDQDLVITLTHINPLTIFKHITFNLQFFPVQINSNRQKWNLSTHFYCVTCVQ